MTDDAALSSTATEPGAARDDVSFTFVVPAHNEHDHLADCVRAIADHLRSHPGSEILVVENGSTDDTWLLAQDLAGRDWGGVGVRALQSEKGLSNAYRVGAAAASAEVLVFTAADLPFGFSDVDHYLAMPAEERPDFAIGSKAHRDSVVDRSITRRAMSFGLFVARWSLLGSRVGDSQGSLLIRRELAQRIVPGTIGGGFVFGAEVATAAEADGSHPVEIPVVLEGERRASTVRPLHDSVSMVASLVAVRRHLDRTSDDRGRRELVEGTAPGRILSWAQGDGPLPRLLGVTTAAALAAIAAFLLTIVAVTTTLDALGDDADPPSTFAVWAAVLAILAVVALVVALVARAAGRASRTGRSPVDAVVPVYRRGQGAAMAGLAGGVSALFALWQVLPHMGSVAVGSGDARYWYWVGWRAAEQIRDGDVVVGGITSVIWPIGASMWPSDGVLTAMVATAWNLLVPDPTLAFNLAIATAIATTAAAGVRLARTLGADPALAAVAGVAVATAPALTIRLEGHYNLLFAFPAILAIDLGLRHVMRRTQPFPVLRMAVLLVLCYLSSGYYFLCVVVVLGAVVLFSGRGFGWLTSTIVRLAAAGLVALVVLSPFLLAKLDLERGEADLGAPAQSEMWMYASDATAVLTPPDGTAMSFAAVAGYNDDFGPNIVEVTAFLGFLAILGLAAIGFYRSTATRPLIAAAMALYVLGLGNVLNAFGETHLAALEWLPAELVLQLPGFAGVRAPNRTSFVLISIGVAAAVVVVGYFRNRDRELLGRVCLFGCIALVALSIRMPTNTTPDIDGDLQQALVAASQLDDPGAVLHLPDDCLVNLSQVEMQIDHRRPEVGCQGFTAAIPWRAGLGLYARSTAWSALRCEPDHIGPLPTAAGVGAEPSTAAVEALRDEVGVGVVVFDRQNRCPERGDEILDALVDAGEVLGGDDRFVVVAVP